MISFDGAKLRRFFHLHNIFRLKIAGKYVLLDINQLLCPQTALILAFFCVLSAVSGIVVIIHFSLLESSRTAKATAAEAAAEAATTIAAATVATAPAAAKATAEAAHTHHATTGLAVAKEVDAVDEMKHGIAGDGVVLSVGTGHVGDLTREGGLLVQDVVELERDGEGFSLEEAL
jgi:hypothetical protein